MTPTQENLRKIGDITRELQTFYGFVAEDRIGGHNDWHDAQIALFHLQRLIDISGEVEKDLRLNQPGKDANE